MPVAVTVARILHPSSFAHEDIGRVYKQHQIVGLRFEKDLVQPFLRFPDVLADYTGVIDLLPVGVLFIPLTPCRDGLVQEDIGSAAVTSRVLCQRQKRGSHTLPEILITEHSV
jgi:hypothetical protein